MFRKMFLLAVLCLVAMASRAQFEQGKKYIGTSLSGFGLSYSANEHFRLGLDADAGYFVSDCLLLKANLGYDHTREIDDIRIGAGARYYFDQCGVYLGTGLEYNHFTPKNNDLMIPLEAGYAFFINQYLTIEPALYYKMSLHDFSNNSTVGLRIGVGYYF